MIFPFLHLEEEPPHDGLPLFRSFCRNRHRVNSRWLKRAWALDRNAWLTLSIPEVVYFVTAINLNEAKAHLGEYVAKAAKGEVINNLRTATPLAELRAISGREEGRAVKLGVLKGAFKETSFKLFLCLL